MIGVVRPGRSNARPARKSSGPLITLQLAKDEGWYGRKDSKWKTIPEKMFMYRGAAWMIDTHAPELSMGIRTDEEIHDTFDAARGPDGHFTVTTESLREIDRGISETATAAASTQRTDSASFDTATGEIIPHFDKDSAIAELKKAQTPKALEESWKSIRQDFAHTKREMPIEVEATYNDRREALSQKGGTGKLEL